MAANLTLSVSLACANWARLAGDLEALDRAGCRELHLDVMDGAFAPDFTLGPNFVRVVKECCGIPCVAHLMVERPELHVGRFVEAGCSTVSVHVEASAHAHRLLHQIRDAGASPGIAIKPATPLTKLDYLLELADRVTILAAEPGGQGPISPRNTFDRIGILRENIRYRELRVKIEAEYAHTVHDAALFSRAGADIVVVDRMRPHGSNEALGEALRSFDVAVAAERHLV